MRLAKCPICGAEQKKCKFSDTTFIPEIHRFGISGKPINVNCKTFNFQFKVFGSVNGTDEDGNTLGIASDNEVRRRYNIICSIMLKSFVENTFKDDYLFFYNEEKKGVNTGNSYTINIASIMSEYPQNNMEKVDRALQNLSLKFKTVGNNFKCSPYLARVVYCEEDSGEELLGMFNLLLQLGFISSDNPSLAVSGMAFSFTANGWKRIYELQKQSDVINQCFIAMSFDPKCEYIAKIFKKTIENRCGYSTKIMNEKEHNNQIVPEIFFEIKQSKFVVVDITYPNHGAYYEAGYAEALGKQVIICCKKSVFDGEENNAVRPHFDIAQKAAVIWKDAADLEERLYRRIEATVGLNR